MILHVLLHLLLLILLIIFVHPYAEILDDRRVLAVLLPLLDLQALTWTKHLAVPQHLELVYVLKKLDVAFYVAGIETRQFVLLLRLLQLLVVCLARVLALLTWHLLN